ncbi:MAG: hypothetical protein LQ338_002649 [Usnochroma carphineum]|nr:MAG: hypothetical protein LQ338_002649 [Usnochroma carphineum]
MQSTPQPKLIQSPQVLVLHGNLEVDGPQLAGLVSMQSLWTRFARHRNARSGSACFSSAALIAQRSTTAPVRRRIGLDDVFTAFFSTVALGSAIAESNRKGARQQEWVKEINDARSELDALKADQERRLSRLGASVRPSPSSGRDVVGRESLQTWQDVFIWAEEEIRERNALGFKAWRGIPLSVLRNAPPDQIQSFLDHHPHHFPKFRGSLGQDVWNTVSWPLHIKKIKTVEWSVARMALELMRHVPDYSDWSLPREQDTAEEVKSQLSISSPSTYQSRLDYIRSQLRRLESGKKSDEYYHQFESPQFPRYSVSQLSDPHSADQLNANLHALLESSPRSSDRITKLLPSICYHLLTSKSSPSIHTYNLLLSEFAGEHRDDLIEHLLRSIARSHMRPNELTLAETLQHYVRTRQRCRFNRYVDEMDGFHDGLGLASPQLDIPDLLKFQYRVRITRRNTVWQNIDEYYNYSEVSKSSVLQMKREATVTVNEKPRRNLEVYEALIQGALAFHVMSEAMKHYRTMISEGWQPNEEILLSILHRCLIDGDWDGGVATWRRLQTLRAPVNERSYVLMLQLCREVNKPESIEELLEHGIQQGVLPPTVVEMGWHDLPRYEKIQDLLKELKTAKDIWTSEQSLEDLLGQHQDTGEVLPQITERISCLTKKIKTSVRHPSHKTIALLREARLVLIIGHKFSAVDTMLRDSNTRIVNITNELDNFQLSAKVQQLETRLGILSSALAQTLRDASNIFFSICVIDLEGCFERISTNATQLVDDFDTQLFCINGKWLRAQFNALNEQTYLIRKEASSFVASLLEPLVLDLKRKLNHLQLRIHATSNGVKGTMATVYGESIKFHKVDGRGNRWSCQLKPMIEHRAAAYASRQDRHRRTDGVEHGQRPTAGKIVPITKYELRQKGAVVRVVASTKAHETNAVPHMEYMIRSKRAMIHGGKPQDTSQTRAAHIQSQCQASDHTAQDTKGISDTVGVPKPWLSNEVLAPVANRVSAGGCSTRHVPFSCLDLTPGHASPSSTYELDYG